MTDAPRRSVNSKAGAIRHLPNALTIVRILLVIPAGWLLWCGAVPEALVLIALAGASDVVDGELARRFDWRTNFGAVLDPAADKLLVFVVIGVLALQGHVPLWLLGLVVGRDLVIVTGALAYRLLLGRYEVEPTMLSKAHTAVLVVVLILVLLALMDEANPVAAVAAAIVDPVGFVVVGALAVASGAHYVVLWGHRAIVGLAKPRPGRLDDSGSSP